MIIVIAEVSTTSNGGVNFIERLTCEFDTEYLTQAIQSLFEKYEGYEIEILYVFESYLNQKDRAELLINQMKK